jgi:EAL domain-containing protein (putative c-di-GMP-specific phosphodiesterase class I)
VCYLNNKKIQIPNSGHVVFISNNEYITNQLLFVLAKINDMEYYDTVFIIPYNNIEDLKNIFINIAILLNKKDKNQLLCSFVLDNYIDILKSMHSFSHIYQKLTNNEIIELIRNGHFYSVMQPIYDIQDKKLYGYEFLLRGKINDNIISPLDIYETAYEIGLQDYLDDRARTISIVKASTLKNKNVKLFVNFLPSVIDSPNYSLKSTFDIAKLNKVSLSNIVFEVVESESIKDLNILKNIFVFYRKNGTTIAMDDIGSGYSSLNNLHKILPDFVKIDRELISFCDINSNKLIIIETIVRLCQSLNILVLAEGIERVEELRVLQNTGIRLAQGYLLGKPSEEEVIVPYIFE